MKTDLSVGGQALSFLLFCATGVLAGVLFDILRCIFMGRFKCKSNVPCDIAISIAESVLIFAAFLKISDMRINLYAFFGIIIGAVLYFLLLGRYFCPFFCFFLKIFEKILKILLSPGKFSCIILFRMCICLYKILSIPVKRIVKLAAKRYEAMKHFAVRLKKI